MQWLRLLVLCVVAVGLVGCDPLGNSTAEDDEEFESAEEKRYAQAGRPFAEAIARGDYPAAYAMLSSHAKARVTPEAFAAEHDAARAEYFVPAASDPAYVLETDPLLLAGQIDPTADQIDQAFARVDIARTIGDVPADVPTDIRKAALSAPLYDVADPDEAEARCAYLTYLLVEENGQLAVAHWFYRWHDMLD